MSDVPPARPNVLFIAIDDLRPFLGCYGDPNAHTPRMDALAQRGVLFRNAMCTAPACGPSRAALMSGRLPTRTGLYGFQDWAGREAFADIVTLPEHFRTNGYRTFASGKIHHDSVRVHSYTQRAVELNAASAEPDPAVQIPRADREWSDNNLPAVQQARYNHRPVVDECVNWGGQPLEVAAKGEKMLSGPSDDPPMACMDGVTASYGVDVLGRQHDQPFFLALGFVRPHLPFIAPRQYFEHYPLEGLELPPVKADDLADVPWVARYNARCQDDINVANAGPDARARIIQAYYACASFVDDLIGMVIDALDASPYRDNTIIAFWSDHGWHLGEKRAWRKFTLWEESARTPMMIVDPRRAATAGGVCDRPVGLIDLYPTLTDVCGLPAREGVDGVSLAPLLDDPAADAPAWHEPELTVLGRNNYSVRDERWRYTRYFDGGEELYTHAEDPYEWTNLADDPAFADEKTRLAAHLPTEAAATFEPRGLVCWAEDDKADMEQFRTDVWPRWLREAHPPLV